MCTKDFSKFIVGAIMTVSYFVYIACSDSLLALILLFIGFIQLIVPIIVEKFMVENYDNTREIEGKLTDYLIDGFKGMSVIKLYNLSEYFMKGLSGLHKDYLKLGIKSEITAQSNNAMDNAVEAILKFGTYVIIGWMILKHKTTMGTGISAIVLSENLFSSMKDIFESLPKIAVGKEAVSRLENLSVRQKSECENASYESDDTSVLIKVQNLSFSYGNKEILSNASFEVKKGDIAVIRSVNGSGKSTLFNILTGLYDNYSGELYIKGNCLKNISNEKYLEDICYLAQDEKGFSKSPSELFSFLKASEQIDYEEAIKLAHTFDLNDEILNDNIIKNLSGGEMKKVYLICCLLKGGNIIFLDEPGNALDAKAREILKDIILNCNKTVIMITHDEFFSKIGTLNISICNGQAVVERKGCSYEENSSDRYIEDNVPLYNSGNTR